MTRIERHLLCLACGAALLLSACANPPAAVKTADGGNSPTPAAVTSPAATGLVYPKAPRGAVVDDYHGTRVADPYRWMEDVDSPAVREWVQAENRTSQPLLESIPQREWVKQRLATLWNYERFDIPAKQGSRYFFRRNDGKQNLSVLYVADDLTAPGRVLFDPNTASSDATISLDQFEPSPDGDVVAYSLSDGGTDWRTWKFRRTRDGSDLEDVLQHSKFWDVSWARDGLGVYYTRYPALANGKGDDAAQPKVYFHKLGEPQSRDKLVYAVPDHPTRTPSAEVTDDGRYLILTLEEGYAANGVRVLDLTRKDAKVQPLFEAWDALYAFIGSNGNELYFFTTQGAPRGRVIAVNPARPQAANWRTIIQETDLALEYAEYVGGRIVASYVKDAHSYVRIHERDGQLVGEVPLPGAGKVAGFTGGGQVTETFFSYMDYLTPERIYRYDTAANKATVWRSPTIPASTSAFVTEQVFFISKDGTRVPMSITKRRDARQDGQQPVLLYGYGGFDVALTPVFRPNVLVWLEMGGIYAEANLRGGSEYGQAWHLAGTKLQKQNVFDDFIGAAEYLIREGYTNPEKLAVHGRSNGGLLVGAVVTQRPELFGAALPAVGVLDMLRYHTASANARQWSSDYGLSENAEEFAALYAYSPYHNVKPGTCYPPTLVTTADHDDRVVPWNSFKFAAALQNAQGCANPVLIRVETRAGHGAGKPVWMQIEDFADQWAFLAKALKMDSKAIGAAGG